MTVEADSWLAQFGHRKNNQYLITSGTWWDISVWYKVGQMWYKLGQSWQRVGRKLVYSFFNHS